MSLSHILADEPPSLATIAPAPVQQQQDRMTIMPPPTITQIKATDDDGDEAIKVTPTKLATSASDGPADDSLHPSTTTSTRRNASGSVSSVYSGNKIKHLKKEDGIPLWRKDIQYDFLHLVFYDTTKCFTKHSDGTGGHTFADVYIDAMAKSSKCSKILKEKLLQDREGGVCMAMVCLLVNVGRMNTTLNFFPEMRAQLRTYHSIPALQAHQDPNAYKQLQDAPRLKSILKGATEDEPQPSTLEEVRAAKRPRTNPVNLIFVMSQYAPKISDMHFSPPRDFFDLVMRSSLSSASRAKAFLWLIWWYLESDFAREDNQRNPFGPGSLPAEGDPDTGDGVAVKVPPLESLTEDQARHENVDSEVETLFGETKRKERIAILASEPSPAMTALKRARKEKGLTSERGGRGGGDGGSDDGGESETGWSRGGGTVTSRGGQDMDTRSDYSRSHSPTGTARTDFQAVNAPTTKASGGMGINNLLNNEDVAVVDAAQPPLPPSTLTATPATTAGATKKGPGRGNWRRKQPSKEAAPLAARTMDSAHHSNVPLLPNVSPYAPFGHAPDTARSQRGPANPDVQGVPYPYHPALASSPSRPYTEAGMPLPSGLFATNPFAIPAPVADHIPTPSYQAQKRGKGATHHQSAVINHRKQQVEYTLDRRLRRAHKSAKDWREYEGAFFRAWKGIRSNSAAQNGASYDSEEEIIKSKRTKEKIAELNGGEPDQPAGAKVLISGFTRGGDVGEEAISLSRSLRRASRRLLRWESTALPGAAMMRRERQAQMEETKIPQQHSRKRKRRDPGVPRPQRRSSGYGTAGPSSRPWQLDQGDGLDLRATYEMGRRHAEEARRRRRMQAEAADEEGGARDVSMEERGEVDESEDEEMDDDDDD